MTFKELKSKLKNELKEIAVNIRELKSKRKQHSNGYVPGLGSAQWDFRMKHIAYCMLRGTPYEKIESKHRDVNDCGHKYCKKRADELLAKYKEQLEVPSEDVCVSA